MIMNKFILGALMAGCLSIGATFADDTKPAGPTAEQKAKLEEMKAKLEAKRGDWKAQHDSLSVEQKAEIEKRMAERKARMEKRKTDMDAVQEKVKHLKDFKAGFETHRKEIEGKRAEWLKDHAGGAKPELTPEQAAELKAKFEEWLKAHADAGAKP